MLQLTPSQLLEWGRGKGYGGGGVFLGPQAYPPQDLSLLPWAQDQATVPLSQAFSAKAQAERSFHVFYELLAGLDPTEREQLSLQEPETYHYLNQVGAGPPKEGSR